MQGIPKLLREGHQVYKAKQKDLGLVVALGPLPIS